MHLLARFRLFGVPVSVHPSSVVVVLLLGWLSGYQRPATLGIWAGVVYVSLLIHELGHALTARSIGSDVSIELNGFGGLTRWTTPEGGLTPGRTALVSAAGSAAGFAFAGVAWLVHQATGPFDGLGELTYHVLFYVNVVWGLLNWLPVRPLDGGHLLLAFLARVAPAGGMRVARAIFVGTAAVAVVAAVRYRLVMAGVLAAWILFSELGAGIRLTTPPPEFGYEEPEPGPGGGETG